MKMRDFFTRSNFSGLWRCKRVIY